MSGCRYVGYDIVPAMVAAGNERFDRGDQGFARFETRDISLSPPGRKFDFVVSSGVFAFGNATFFRSSQYTRSLQLLVISQPPQATADCQPASQPSKGSFHFDRLLVFVVCSERCEL